MSERRVRTAIVVFALAGAGIAGYLLYERYTGGRIACTSGGCETVQHSRYAKIAGVPVALLGLLGYAGLLAAAVVRGETARAAGAAIALSALAFSVYLLAIQLAVIHAVCVWCVGSDGVVTAVTVLTVVRIRVADRDRPVPT
jgi:uncharacterized membrane protein